MPDENLTETSLDEAEDAAAESQIDAAIAVEQAADKSETSIDHGGSYAAILRSQDRIAEQNTRLETLLSRQTDLLEQNLNAFSRSLANTDISAQQAAEQSAAVKEIVEPPDEQSPDQGEQPAQIEELPKREAERKSGLKNPSLGFGKAAARHGHR